jgi:hypothetical protein
MSKITKGGKEIKERLKKILEKLVAPGKEKKLPQLILQPYRPGRKF